MKVHGVWWWTYDRAHLALVPVEEVNAVGDAVLDDRSLGVAANELCGSTSKLIGEQEGRFLVAQVGDCQLPDRPVVGRQ